MPSSCVHRASRRSPAQCSCAIGNDPGMNAIATLLAAPTVRPGYDPDAAATARRVLPMLDGERVVWLSTVRPDGTPHLVPTWFLWDGEALLVWSKPNAVKVRNLRANPRLMVALGDPAADFNVGLIEAAAELVDDRRRPHGVPRQVRVRARPGRPRSRDVPRDLHPGGPDRPDALPRLARPGRKSVPSSRRRPRRSASRPAWPPASPDGWIGRRAASATSAVPRPSRARCPPARDPGRTT